MMFLQYRPHLGTLDLLLPSTFSSSNLLPPPSYSSKLLHPPPKPPPNSSYLLLKGLRWLISSYMKRFQCYSAQKSFMVGGWWIHCNYRVKLQVQVAFLLRTRTIGSPPFPCLIHWGIRVVNYYQISSGNKPLPCLIGRLTRVMCFSLGKGIFPNIGT